MATDLERPLLFSTKSGSSKVCGEKFEEKACMNFGNGSCTDLPKDWITFATHCWTFKTCLDPCHQPLPSTSLWLGITTRKQLADQTSYNKLLFFRYSLIPIELHLILFDALHPVWATMQCQTNITALLDQVAHHVTKWQLVPWCIINSFV